LAAQEEPIHPTQQSPRHCAIPSHSHPSLSALSRIHEVPTYRIQWHAVARLPHRRSAHRQ
jgi:hypothetical protein